VVSCDAGVLAAVNFTFRRDIIALGVRAACTALLPLDLFVFYVLKHYDYKEAATTATQ
jgi:hypothetical protein